MPKFIKVSLYWLTVIPPLFDAIKGALMGISKGLNDIKQGAAKAEQQAAAWEKANRGE